MGRGFTGRAEGRAHKTATEPMPERRGRPDSFPLSTYSAPGDLRQDPGRAAESLAEARTYGNGSREMRVLLSTYGSRGDVEPLAGLAVRLRALGADVRVCASPDFAERPAEVGVPLVPAAADVPRRAAELIAEKSRQCPREPHGTVEPGTPRTREPTNPGDLNRQRPRGPHQAERFSSWPPGSSRRSRRLLRATAASDPRSELMT